MRRKVSDDMSNPEIYFYVPKEKLREDWPKTLSDNWVAFGGGANIWSYFTPVALTALGYPVHITSDIPDTGIVLSHAQYLPRHRLVNDRTLLVCIRADYGRNHPADVHVVQNAFQQKLRGREILENLFYPGPNYYIPQWPQPGLIPRDERRGNTFRNVVFLGAVQNLAEFCKSEEWAANLRAQGIEFRIVRERACWHDYSEVDAVLAIRPATGDSHYRKPPSKLTNAWLAGVPAILGPDSAFQELRSDPLDYLEITNREEALAAILRLRDDPSLRQRMVHHGQQRAADYTIQANFERWKHFFENFAIPYYKEWRAWNAPKQKTYFLLKSMRAAIKR